MDIGNTYSRKRIKDIKEWTIKNMLYSGIKVPSVWQTKQNYRETVYGIIQKDTTFLDYLMKMENKEQSSEIKKYSNNKSREENEYSNMNIQTNLENMSENKRSGSVDITSYNTKTKSSFRNSHIENLPKIKLSGYLNVINENKENENNSRIGSTHQFFSGRSSPKRSTNSKGGFRSTSFYKTSQNGGSANKTMKSSFNMTTQNHSQQQSNSTTYGPFLNIDYEKINKKIEINNPTIKKMLQDVDYYGPYFSHCPSCSNKNLEYFKNINPEQGEKILSYIRDKKDNTNGKGKNKFFPGISILKNSTRHDHHMNVM